MQRGYATWLAMERGSFHATWLVASATLSKIIL